MVTRNCCSCAADPTPEVCLTQVTSADLATLVYISGLDVNLCHKYQAVAAALQLTDCAGNLIALNTPIVTCAAFQAQLCATFALLATGAPVVLGVTQLVGDDCLTHVVPETPIVVVDTAAIDLTSSGAFGHTLQANLIISPDVGNIAVIHPNGLYVPDTDVCTDLQAFPVGVPVVFGVTPVLGNDCQTHIVNETPFTATDTSTIDFTTSGAFGHNLTGVVNVSGTLGNEIVVLPDGLYAPAPTAVVLSAVDTTCLDLNVTQAPPGNFVITGAPVISPNPGNSISCAGNGLFVPAAAAQTPVTLTPVDTSCFDSVIGGVYPNFTISGNPVISPNADNALSCLPNGLFASDVSIAVQDTDCIDLEVVEGPGSNDFVLTANLNISAVAGNTVACLADGLYVNPAAGSVTIQPGDTTCVNTTVIEAPPGTFTISSVPVISPTAGNQLTCSPNGLLVPAAAVAAPFTLTPTDTACLNLDVGGVSPNFTITGNPIVDPDAPGYPVALGCNGLRCDAGGMWTQPDDVGYTEESGSIFPVVGPGQLIVTGNVFPLTISPICIASPALNCRDSIVTVYTRIPELLLNSPGPVVVHIVLNHDINYPGATPPVVTGGFVQKTEWWLNAGAGNSGTAGGTIVNVFYLPAGQSGSFCVEGTMTVESAAAGTVARVNGIVVRATQVSV